MAKRKKEDDQRPPPPRLSAGDEHGQDGFLIVGIGASAGGFEAYQHMLRELPSDLGAAIVLVQHMAPQHESALATLLTSSTNLPVVQPSQHIELEANHVYVVPPNRTLTLNDGTLMVQPRPTDRSQFTPVDTLFQSLAKELGPAAIGVILSGTASDGVEGIHAIKAAGGRLLHAIDDGAAGYRWLSYTYICTTDL